MRLLAALLVSVASAQTLWHPPKPSEAAPPQPPYTFVREDPSGTQPKLFVRDARGSMWNVKFGFEARNEAFCWRIVEACGYFAEPTFFIAEGRLERYQPLKRGTESIQPDGRFTAARFQYRDPGLKFSRGRNWRWDRPPFAGTKELSGLKILIMLFSNWDNKDARVGAGGPNTAVFVRAGRPLAAFVDWGSGMGRWGSKPGTYTDWNCADYTAQTPEFVKGIERGHVIFGWEGVINEAFRDNIPPAHVVWLMERLGKITDDELRAWLKAAGGNDADVDCFARALRARIDRLRKAAAR